MRTKLNLSTLTLLPEYFRTYITHPTIYRSSLISLDPFDFIVESLKFTIFTLCSKQLFLIPNFFDSLSRI